MVRESFEQAAARLQSQRPLRNRRLQQIAAGLQSSSDAAETALKQFLATHPEDPDALMLMARVAQRSGDTFRAIKFLERCLACSPDFVLARFEYAKLLARTLDYNEALAQAEQLLASDRHNPQFRQFKAVLLAAMGENHQAVRIFDELASENLDRPDAWVKYGDALRVTGSHQKSVAAYRHAISCRPGSGPAWWRLAGLRTFRFDRSDIEKIQEQLAKRDITPEDRVDFLFCLGKAYEDGGEYARAFECYAKGNAARRLSVDRDAEALTSRVEKKKAVFTRDFFASRKEAGYSEPGPIFVLGRPRSGSTLVEQILCSHSAVEGTTELPYIADFALRILQRECRAQNVDYPEVFTRLPSAAIKALGEEYMVRTRIHRKTDRPFFVDKAMANYHHVGLIHLILPNAKIIDTRRHPVANCLSMFKHNYKGTSLRLHELGRVYCEYVALMAHFDRNSSGRIHRVIYEELVDNLESEVRRLLEFLELPFEENCLRFYESSRTVRSPSSEQVRQPLSREPLDHWRNFEPWLAPLLQSLGSVLTAYPDVPQELL